MRDCIEFCGKVLFVCLGVCAEFYFTVFAKTFGGPCHEYPRVYHGGNATIYWKRIDPKTVFYTMREIIMFGKFL